MVVESESWSASSYSSRAYYLSYIEASTGLKVSLSEPSSSGFSFEGWLLISTSLEWNYSSLSSTSFFRSSPLSSMRASLSLNVRREEERLDFIWSEASYMGLSLSSSWDCWVLKLWTSRVRALISPLTFSSNSSKALLLTSSNESLSLCYYCNWSSILSYISSVLWFKASICSWTSSLVAKIDGSNLSWTSEKSSWTKPLSSVFVVCD